MSRAKRLLPLVAVAAFAFTADAQQQTTAYESINTTGGDGASFTTTPHLLQVLTLNVPNAPFRIPSMILGVRVNAPMTEPATIVLRFWSNVDTSAGAANALAAATLLNSASFTFSPQSFPASYTFSTAFPANFILPTNTFGLEVSYLNAAGTAFSTELGGSLTTGAPLRGSNDGFIYSESDGTFAGSERTQAIGATSGVPVRTNLLVALFTVPVPEPSTWALALGGAGVLGLVTRRRRGASGLSPNR